MRILACAAHPDDVELSCGGTLAGAFAAGHETYILDLTRGERASNGDPESRAKEAAEAAETLGAHRFQAGLPDGGLDSRDSTQRATVVEIMREIRPDLLIIPCRENRHPDHREAHELLHRVSFDAGLPRFPAPGEAHRPVTILEAMERIPFAPHILVPIDEWFEKKQGAILAYKSQFSQGPESGKTLINEEQFLVWLTARDQYYGGLAHCKVAEPFRLASPLRIDQLHALVPEAVND
ncbi:MAG: bacillithiol biosynthesis deacetylase BshB1 [Candidatus Krumholzibacteria bacterium]|jgi:bacillithiol biosynthesis deacetylase BshB1|nr:bacillithiol biosynthesis deacetylase BshB1 [Candidatus Krumholzibacteria bacterium]MDP6669949.1 bacillithiol biosynthesis deacetylase BshB1 [Candidatus Krumholzibacteria bacterium]MDP6797722.1 bacillithiol biosynthesis deacetylase BshB1 [Candidatus Krumholzibacteria bacterium]MDP7020823.1 bacillithiol biosynthesis deacetylase BshB1 [Candidatus Krumholzibacteria bacterium]